MSDSSVFRKMFLWLTHDISSVVVAWVLQVQQDRVYWIKAAGIEVFAVFWLVKSLELSASQAEAKAMAGTLPPPDSD